MRTLPKFSGGGHLATTLGGTAFTVVKDKPATQAALWSFLNSYNSLLWPLIVISEPEDYTLPMGIQALFGATGRQYDLVLAGAVLAAVPSLLVFFLLRKQLLEGLTAGAVRA